jgi:hypothetical protein
MVELAGHPNRPARQEESTGCACANMDPMKHIHPAKHAWWDVKVRSIGVVEMD